MKTSANVPWAIGPRSRALALALATAGVAAAAADDAPPAFQDPLPAARRAYVAARIYADVERYFAHWQGDARARFDDAFRAYLERAMSAGDRRAFTDATLELMAGLGNGHTGFADNALFAAAGRDHGFIVRHLGGAWLVVRSDRPDLAAGDPIASIDGEPIEAFYQRQKPTMSASTDRYRRRRLFDRWQRYRFPLRYTLGLVDGRAVAIDRRDENAEPAREPAVEGRWIEPDRIAYLRVPSWSEARFEQDALARLEELAGAPALVIDVRGNAGGTSPIAFIAALMDRPWSWWSESTPMGFGVFAFYGGLDTDFADLKHPQLAWRPVPEEPEARFTGRLAILIDEGCHSACEDFAMPFKHNGRAFLVGTATAGSTGQPAFVSYGDGMGASIGSKRAMFPDGSPFEGIGIAPDLEVAPTAADLRAARDPALAAAVRRLAAALGAGSGSER